MYEPTTPPPSPPPVPWPYHPPDQLSRTRDPYDYARRADYDPHSPHDRQELFGGHSQSRAPDNYPGYRHSQNEVIHTRTEQTHHHTVPVTLPPQPIQCQQARCHHYDSLADLRDLRGGPERWSYLGRDYTRDNPDSGWVEVRYPTVPPVTEIYGIPEGDPMYRPHLRYTPRSPSHGDEQPVPTRNPDDRLIDEQSLLHAMHHPQMAPPHPASRASASRAQPVGNNNDSHQEPRSWSPLPLPYRPELAPMRREPRTGNGDYVSRFLPIHSSSRAHDASPAPQHNEMRDFTSRASPRTSNATHQRQDPASSHVPNERLETREDPWEFLFGSKGYVTLGPNDERPAWWED